MDYRNLLDRIRQIVRLAVRQIVRDELESMRIVSDANGGYWRLVHKSKLPNEQRKEVKNG